MLRPLFPPFTSSILITGVSGGCFPVTMRHAGLSLAMLKTVAHGRNIQKSIAAQRAVPVFTLFYNLDIDCNCIRQKSLILSTFTPKQSGLSVNSTKNLAGISSLLNLSLWQKGDCSDSSGQRGFYSHPVATQHAASLVPAISQLQY